MWCISLSGWSAPLPLCHKHPVTSRWWGQPGHGKPKGAVKLTDGRSLEGHEKPAAAVTKTLPTDGVNSRAWETLQMSASHPWKISVGCLMSHQVFPDSKDRMWLMQLPHAVVQCQKRFGNVFEGIKRTPPSHSLQLPPNFRMVYKTWITAQWIRVRWITILNTCVTCVISASAEMTTWRDTWRASMDWIRSRDILAVSVEKALVEKTFSKDTSSLVNPFASSVPGVIASLKTLFHWPNTWDYAPYPLVLRVRNNLWNWISWESTKNPTWKEKPLPTPSLPNSKSENAMDGSIVACG